MPYQTLVPATTITSSWANANVRDQVITPFATASARSSAITSPVEGMLSYRTDGKKFEGYDGATWVGVPFTVAAFKTADETISSSTTLQPDDALFWAVAASATYALHVRVRCFSGTTPDIKFGWTFPTGLTMNWGTTAYTTAGAFGQNGNNSESGVAAAGGIAADTWIDIHGLVTVSSTAGTLTLTWAQNTSDPSNTVVKGGSWGTLTRVA